MCEYAEMFALVYNTEIRGYRIYITVDGNTSCFDIQTENTGLCNWIQGRLQLKRVGNLLLTQDEINKEVQPKLLSDKSKIKELLGQVRYYKELSMGY